MDKITKEELIQYSKEHGAEYAYNLLLLGGPDFYAEDDYFEFLNSLSRESTKEE